MIHDMNPVILDGFFQMSADLIIDNGAYDNTGIWVSSQSSQTILCHIQPLTSKSDILNLPEGTQAQDCKKMYTSSILPAGFSNYARGSVNYKNKRYTIFNVQDFSEYGYFKSLLILDSNVNTITAGTPPTITPPVIANGELQEFAEGTFPDYRTRKVACNIVAGKLVLSMPPKVILGEIVIYSDSTLAIALGKVADVTVLANEIDLLTNIYDGKVAVVQYNY